MVIVRWPALPLRSPAVAGGSVSFLPAFGHLSRSIAGSKKGLAEGIRKRFMQQHYSMRKSIAKNKQRFSQRIAEKREDLILCNQV
jgi:hypothetical protein